MPSWTRWEKWHRGEAKFVELAVEGSTLFVRTGRCRVGPGVEVETRAMASMEEARAALDAEQSALAKKKFLREKTFEAPLPKAPLALKKKRLEGRWREAEKTKKKALFFDRLRAAGIDPEKDFAQQGDANARASTCLALAEELLLVHFSRKYFGRDLTGEHDGFDRRNPQEIPYQSYGRFYRSPSQVFSIAARAGVGASTGESDGEWRGT